MKKLSNFLTNLGILHESIKFDHEKATHSIPFEVTLIYFNKKGKLQNPPTHTHTHTHHHDRAFHSEHLKESLFYSQAIRLRRICTDNNELKGQGDKLK